MLKSTQSQRELQPHTIRVKQLPNGRFEATTPNVPNLRVEASTRQMATAMLDDRLVAAVKGGTLHGTV